MRNPFLSGKSIAQRQAVVKTCRLAKSGSRSAGRGASEPSFIAGRRLPASPWRPTPAYRKKISVFKMNTGMRIQPDQTM
jgi:hypothetical protein